DLRLHPRHRGGLGRRTGTATVRRRSLSPRSASVRRSRATTQTPARDALPVGGAGRGVRSGDVPGRARRTVPPPYFVLVALDGPGGAAPGRCSGGVRADPAPTGDAGR